MSVKLLSMALAALACSIAAPAIAQTGISTVPSEVFAKATGGATVIDVREPAEWAQTGVPAGAQTISISRPDFVDAVLKAVKGDKSRPIAVICRSGSRSVRAAEQLAAAGFTSVTNIADGMAGRESVGKGWLAAQLPVKHIESGQ